MSRPAESIKPKHCFAVSIVSFPSLVILSPFPFRRGRRCCGSWRGSRQAAVMRCQRRQCHRCRSSSGRRERRTPLPSGLAGPSEVVSTADDEWQLEKGSWHAGPFSRQSDYQGPLQCVFPTGLSPPSVSRLLEFARWQDLRCGVRRGRVRRLTFSLRRWRQWHCSRRSRWCRRMHSTQPGFA